MAMRMSGLMSGMDTESIVQQLVEVRSKKVTKTKNNQTKLEWKQDIWKGLNSKLKTLQSKLQDLRFSSSYTKKTTKTSNDNAVSVLTGDAAMNGVQELEISQMAKTSYMTGGKVSLKEGISGSDVDNDTIMGNLMDFQEGETKTLTVNTGSGTKNIELTRTTTISDVLTQLKNAGLNASFDANQKRFFVGGKESGETDNFEIKGDQDALKALGLNVTKTISESGEEGTDGGATYIKGQDAKIILNGVEYTNSNNTFEINGLTITAHGKTNGEKITLTTQRDTDGIYDMIKDFFKAYNDVINEMDKLYNADSAKDYEPLSDDEKSNMSETEIEKYEQKIKDSLLRRDENVSKVSMWLKKLTMESYSVDGRKMGLANFGIETLNYFSAPDNERNAYHINGDSDDENVSSKEDKLKAMIASDPDTVISFFTQMSQKLYSKMNELSSSVEGYRSFGSFYDDKKMKSDYDDYKTKIKEQEKKLSDYEDKWYKKFAAMETAMAKMQSNASAVTSLLGGSQ